MRNVIKNLIKTRQKDSDEMREKLFIDSMIDYDQIDEEEVH